MSTPPPPSPPITPRRSILIVDDDADIVRALALLLGRAGFACHAAANPDEALTALAGDRFDAILLDLNFARGRTSGDEGMVLLRRIIADDPAATVIVLTGHSGLALAVTAMRMGARDFITKPWSNPRLLATVEQALKPEAEQPMAASTSPTVPNAVQPMALLLGESPQIAELRRLIARAAPSAAPVLFHGPPGSGKTLAARALHAASPDAHKPLVALDARLLVTGVWPEPARAELAGGGSLVIEAVDALDGPAQARLLALDGIARQGGAPVRLISTATSMDGLNGDTIEQLAMIDLTIPALGERQGDALWLAQHFARRIAQRDGRAPLQFSEDAIKAIAAAAWSDNIRGLMRAIERANLYRDNTDSPVTPAQLGMGGTDTGTDEKHEPRPTPRAPTLEQTERHALANALKRHGFNVSHAAAELGLSRGALYRRMAKYGL